MRAAVLGLSGEKMKAAETTVKGVVAEIAELKGALNCIDEIVKRTRQELDKRKKQLTEKLVSDLEAKMAWLEQNAEEKHFQGDLRVTGLSWKQSQTIELCENWHEAPRELLKVAVDKTKAKKYIEDAGGDVPTGIVLVNSPKKMSVLAKSMTKISEDDLAYLTKSFDELKNE